MQARTHQLQHSLLNLLVAMMAGTFALYLVIVGLSRSLPVAPGVALAISLAVALGVYLLSVPLIARAATGLENRNQSLRRLFRIPLIAAAAVLSFAHGANDVANAVGPVAAIFSSFGDAEAAEMLAVRDMLEFDSVSPDGSTYTVGGKEYFMPYVPGYVTSGPGELALFSITADDAGADGAAQVRLVVEKLQRVLSELGLKFDDVVVLWNRCAHLDEIEEAVLMTRSRDFGLTRPLAEAVLEVVETDPNPAGAALEYIVVAKLPRALAEVRALA